MGSSSQPSEPNAHEIAAVLEQMWARYLPDILARVAALEQASAALTAGSLSQATCEAAESAAHKLAGTLGTFSLPRGTEIARELEQAFGADDGPDIASAPQIAASVKELRVMIEGRPTSG